MLEIQTDKDILQNNHNLNQINENSMSASSTFEEATENAQETVKETSENVISSITSSIVSTPLDTNSVFATSDPSNTKSDIPEPNCLALTVRKDYNLTIIKNIFTKSGRMSLRIALSTLVLNFLRLFF